MRVSWIKICLHLAKLGAKVKWHLFRTRCSDETLLWVKGMNVTLILSTYLKHAWTGSGWTKMSNAISRPIWRELDLDVDQGMKYVKRSFNMQCYMDTEYGLRTKRCLHLRPLKLVDFNWVELGRCRFLKSVFRFLGGFFKSLCRFRFRFFLNIAISVSVFSTRTSSVLLLVSCPCWGNLRSVML